MATKRARTSGKKVESLRPKSLSGKNAKRVKGGSLSFGAAALKQADGSVTKVADGSVFKVQKV